MKKSVYSLVLSDDVVAAADRAAAKRGLSRSALINEILADRLSCTTPEMRIRDIFHNLERIALGENFRMKERPSDAMMSLLSSLSYKYNPTVRYSVELTHKTSGVIGILKVSFRTQSESFTKALSGFFYLFCRMEESYAPVGVKYKTEAGRFSRLLAVPEGEQFSAEETGQAISDFIKMFDMALNAYFGCLPDNDEAVDAAAAVYRKYLKNVNYRI